MCFSLRWRLFCVLGGIISRAEYSKSPSVSRETIPPRRLAEEGVKNWPGRRNRLPHPVCKPLDSKEGGADGFVCRAAWKPIFHSFSALSLTGYVRIVAARDEDNGDWRPHNALSGTAKTRRRLHEIT